MGILVSFVIVIFAFFVAEKLLDGLTIKGGLGSRIVVALLFAIVNALLGSALYFAIGIGTLGLGFILSFLGHLVATAVVLKVVDALTDRLKVRDFKTAFLAALVMALATSVAEAVVLAVTR